MKGNSLLFSLRKERKLSLFKVSKGSKINLFLLFNMERGYWRISTKSAEKLGAYYNVEPSSLLNEDDIPSSIKPHKGDSTRFFSAIKRFFMSKITLIVSAIISLVGGVIAPISGVKLLDMDDNYLYYYNEGYISVYDQVADLTNAGDLYASIGTMPLFYVVNGAHTNNYSMYQKAESTEESYSLRSVDYSDYESEGGTTSWITKIYEFLNKEHLGFSIVDLLNLYMGDSANWSEGKTSIRFNRDENGANIHFFEYEMYNATYSARLRLASSESSYNVEFNILYNGGEQYILYGGYDLVNPIKIYSVVRYSMDSLMLQYIPLEEGNSIIKDVTDVLISIFDKAMSNFSSLLSVLDYKDGASTFMKSYIEDDKNVKSKWIMLTVIFSLSSILGSLAVCVFFIGLILILTKKDPEEEKASPIEQEEDKEEHRELPRNWPFGPFIKEGYYRIAGLGLVFAGNLLAPIVASNIFATFNNIVNLTKVVDAFSLYPYQLFGSFVLITVLLNILLKGKNLPFKAATFMAGGLIYYVLELVVEMQLLRKSTVLATAVEYLPGNLFWSIGIFAFISLFLFHTPKGCDSKKKEIGYRCCSLIPVAYIFVSATLSYLRKKHIITLSLFVKDLLLQKSNLLLLYGVLFLYGVYFLRLYLDKRYGYKEAKRFRNSSQYALYQNIVMLVALSVPIVMDIFASDIPFFSMLGFNHNPYLWILLPMFAFYRPRIPERDGFLDACYVVAVSLVWFVPYFSALLMFINWMPF